MVLGWAPMAGPRLFCAKEDTGGILWVTSVCGCPKITPNAAASRKRLHPESGCIPKAAASRKRLHPESAYIPKVLCAHNATADAGGMQAAVVPGAAPGTGSRQQESAAVDSNQTGSSTGCGGGALSPLLLLLAQQFSGAKLYRNNEFRQTTHLVLTHGCVAGSA